MRDPQPSDKGGGGGTLELDAGLDDVERGGDVVGEDLVGRVVLNVRDRGDVHHHIRLESCHH